MTYGQTTLQMNKTRYYTIMNDLIFTNAGDFIRSTAKAHWLCLSITL